MEIALQKCGTGQEPHRSLAGHRTNKMTGSTRMQHKNMINSPPSAAVRRTKNRPTLIVLKLNVNSVTNRIERSIAIHHWKPHQFLRVELRRQ